MPGASCATQRIWVEAHVWDHVPSKAGRLMGTAIAFTCHWDIQDMRVSCGHSLFLCFSQVHGVNISPNPPGEEP